MEKEGARDEVKGPEIKREGARDKERRSER